VFVDKLSKHVKSPSHYIDYITWTKHSTLGSQS